MNCCGRWNTTVLAMTGVKAMVLAFLRCYIELVMECGRCYTTLCQDYRSCIIYAHDVCPLPPFVHVRGSLPMVIDWAPTTGLRPCQIQLEPAHG